tara:strand:+ start:40 stop:501 length:462 start_codon:yes stop_codon:yes gene_type:complete
MIISLNQKEILEVQQNKPPYLLIDYVDELVPGSYAKGYKDFGPDEWFFKVHWENDPNVPGMLQIESLIQMSAISILSLPGNRGKIMYLTSATKLKFIKKIIPNSRMYIDTKIKSYKRGIANCEGMGTVNKEIVCKAEFSLVLPDEINKFSKKT